MQGGEREAAELLNAVMRASVREAFWAMMSEEVESLCGRRYHPEAGSEYRRAGSEKGRAYLDGGKEEIVRPRVRHTSEGEVELESYRAAASQAGLFEDIVAHVAEGMSQRGLERARQGDISKSSISRMWAEKSREQLELVRERSLEDGDWLALMIDGVFVGGENCVVVALGIDRDGHKRVLDFETGSSESLETVSRVVESVGATRGAISQRSSLAGHSRWIGGHLGRGKPDLARRGAADLPGASRAQRSGSTPNARPRREPAAFQATPPSPRQNRRGRSLRRHSGLRSRAQRGRGAAAERATRRSPGRPSPGSSRHAPRHVAEHQRH